MKKNITLFSATLLLASLLGGAKAFAETNNNTPNPNSATTQVTGELKLSENGGFNPNPPSPDLNEKTGIGKDSYFGIAYKPKTFNLGTVALADTNDEQNIVMVGPTNTEGNNKSFHIAVKDKLRENNRAWTLKAKLVTAIEDQNLGITIKTGTKSNSVMRNVNEGEEAFKSGELVEQVKKDGSTKEVTNTADFEITTSDKVIMQSTKGKFVNGAYDLELPQVELHIPNASKVKAQTINTNVTWTLENAAK